MNQIFAAEVEHLHRAFELLLAMSPARHGSLPHLMPEQGVYLFSEGERHLYVGRSNHLRRRVGQHCNVGSQHNQAVFAYRLARAETGHIAPAYIPGDRSRAGLLADAAFLDAFSRAKARVRLMDFRCVEETVQVRQALLEIYCAILLGCPYNDFGTH